MERDIYDEDHEAFRDVVKEFIKRYATTEKMAQWEADGEIDRATMLARMSVANSADIPPPVEIEDVQKAGKATDSDIAESTWWQKALQDPATWVPAVGGVATPMLSGTGPIQWAFAAVIVLGAVYAVTRALRRSV